MNDGDALRCAKLLLDRYGEGAAEMAALCADGLMTVGDEGGWRAWMRILRVIGELARTARRPRRPGEAQH